MNLVHQNRFELFNSKNTKDGVLKRWLMSNTQKTIKNFVELEKSNFKKPLTVKCKFYKFFSNIFHLIIFLIFKVNDNIKFEAYIDVENKFQMNDKFSLVNTLTQLENLQAYEFLKDPLQKKKTSVYAMWLDIYTGDVYFFSQTEKTFVKLVEENFEKVSKSLDY